MNASTHHDQGTSATPERISSLASALQEQIAGSIREIGNINLQSRVLSMNAQIEAARAGQAGRAFGVLGQEMVNFSGSIQVAARNLEQRAEVLVRELADISRLLATQVRGTRLADLALTNIDVIDRNLYERSCDCRWWATDAAVVDALQQPGDEARTQHCSTRLGVILKAYTVYFDIVVADRNGRIVANGRPDDFKSVGTQHADATWFRSAMATSTGNDFGFQGVHTSTLASGKRVLVYSCKVCEGGDASAAPIGVLGVIFNWDGLAQKVVMDTALEPEKKAHTRVCIVDEEGLVLADSWQRMLTDRIDPTAAATLFAASKGSTMLQLSGTRCLIGHARSPGFETYRTGWYSFILEQLSRDES